VQCHSWAYWLATAQYIHLQEQTPLLVPDEPGTKWPLSRSHNYIINQRQMVTKFIKTCSNGILKKNCSNDILEKKNMIKSIQLCKVWGLLHLWKLCTAHSFATFFLWNTALLLVISCIEQGTKENWMEWWCQEPGLGGLIIRFRRCFSPQTEWQETHQTGTSFKEAIFENERLSFSRIIQISIYHNETIYIVFSNISNWTLWDVTNWLSQGEIKTNLSFTWKIKFLHEVLLYEERRQIYIPRTE